MQIQFMERYLVVFEFGQVLTSVVVNETGGYCWKYVLLWLSLMSNFLFQIDIGLECLWCRYILLCWCCRCSLVVLKVFKSEKCC